jgi:hypothetical protein
VRERLASGFVKSYAGRNQCLGDRLPAEAPVGDPDFVCVEARGDHTADEGVALQPMCEVRVLVEVLLAIPGKALSLTAESGCDEMSADLIEQPVSLGLTERERTGGIEAVDHAMAMQPQQTILAATQRAEEEQSQLVGREDLLSVEKPGDLTVALGRSLGYLPGEGATDTRTSRRSGGDRQITHLPLSRFGEGGVLQSHAGKRALWQQSTRRA